ncbi:hypothetical protein EON65_18060 [archaeon]|nr:MAG: hypothetical protein EON65_18060 [archaeon]
MLFIARIDMCMCSVGVPGICFRKKSNAVTSFSPHIHSVLGLGYIPWRVERHKGSDCCLDVRL